MPRPDKEHSDRVLVEDVEFLLEVKTPIEQTPGRLGTTMAALEIRLRRVGRGDLAAPFRAPIKRATNRRSS